MFFRTLCIGSGLSRAKEGYALWKINQLSQNVVAEFKNLPSELNITGKNIPPLLQF